jgi:hypothetical protein
MKKSKLHFEQVPLEIIKGLIEQPDVPLAVAADAPAAPKKASVAPPSATAVRRSRAKL